jgi:hypothetical protein
MSRSMRVIWGGSMQQRHRRVAQASGLCALEDSDLFIEGRKGYAQWIVDRPGLVDEVLYVQQNGAEALGQINAGKLYIV